MIKYTRGAVAANCTGVIITSKHTSNGFSFFIFHVSIAVAPSPKTISLPTRVSCSVILPTPKLQLIATRKIVLTVSIVPPFSVFSSLSVPTSSSFFFCAYFYFVVCSSFFVSCFFFFFFIRSFFVFIYFFFFFALYSFFIFRPSFVLYSLIVLLFLFFSSSSAFSQIYTHVLLEFQRPLHFPLNLTHKTLNAANIL